jgi:hypothetical protein
VASGADRLDELFEVQLRREGLAEFEQGLGRLGLTPGRLLGAFLPGHVLDDPHESVRSPVRRGHDAGVDPDPAEVALAPDPARSLEWASRGHGLPGCALVLLAVVFVHHPVEVGLAEGTLVAGAAEDLVDELVLPVGALLLHAPLEDAEPGRGACEAQAVLALAERLLRLREPFGHVAGDLGEAAQSSFVVAESRDDDVGYERGAVLAESHSLVLEASVARRDPQLLLREAQADLLLGVEDGEVFPQDLLGLVALESLGADVPGRDVSFRVEHEDRVVADRLDEEPEALVGVLSARSTRFALVHGVPPQRGSTVVLAFEGSKPGGEQEPCRPRASCPGSKQRLAGRSAASLVVAAPSSQVSWLEERDRGEM